MFSHRSCQWREVKQLFENAAISIHTLTELILVAMSSHKPESAPPACTFYSNYFIKNHRKQKKSHKVKNSMEMLTLLLKTFFNVMKYKQILLMINIEEAINKEHCEFILL